LFNGELSIPGNLLRREVFDPVVSQVRYLFQLVFARLFFRRYVYCVFQFG
jgi:hypothetical protein